MQLCSSSVTYPIHVFEISAYLLYIAIKHYPSYRHKSSLELLILIRKGTYLYRGADIWCFFDKTYRFKNIHSTLFFQNSQTLVYVPKDWNTSEIHTNIYELFLTYKCLKFSGINLSFCSLKLYFISTSNNTDISQ